MTRKCPCCKETVTFYKMKGHAVIYCSLCLEPVKVPSQELSWYDHDDNEGDPS